MLSYLLKGNKRLKHLEMKVDSDVLEYDVTGFSLNYLKLARNLKSYSLEFLLYEHVIDCTELYDFISNQCTLEVITLRHIAPHPHMISMTQFLEFFEKIIKCVSNNESIKRMYLYFEIGFEENDTFDALTKEISTICQVLIGKNISMNSIPIEAIVHGLLKPKEESMNLNPESFVVFGSKA